MLKLKLQYFGDLMRRVDSFEKTLMLGKIEGRRKRGRQRKRCLDDINDSMGMGLGGLWQLVMDREAWRAAVHRVAKSRTWLSDWTELNFESVALESHPYSLYLDLPKHFLRIFRFKVVISSHTEASLPAILICFLCSFFFFFPSLTLATTKRWIWLEVRQQHERLQFVLNLNLDSLLWFYSHCYLFTFWKSSILTLKKEIVEKEVSFTWYPVTNWIIRIIWPVAVLLTTFSRKEENVLSNKQILEKELKSWLCSFSLFFFKFCVV